MSGRNRTGPPCIVDGRTAYDPVARGLISWYRPIPDQSLTADSSAYTPDHDQVIQRIPDVCVCVCFSNKRLLFSFKVCGLFLTTCTNISLSPVSLVNLCTISHISIPLDCISQNTRNGLASVRLSVSPSRLRTKRASSECYNKIPFTAGAMRFTKLDKGTMRIHVGSRYQI